MSSGPTAADPLLGLLLGGGVVVMWAEGTLTE